MAETSGFFDAEELLDGEFDREYVAEQFANYFKLLVGNGVFASPTNQLKVIVDAGMFVTVKPGWAWINGYWYHNDTDLSVEVPVNVTATTVTHGVFIHYDATERETHIVIGENRTTPNRVTPVYELKVAEIAIPPGSTAVTTAMITDTRPDNTVCGFVSGLIDIIDTTDLFNQYNAIFSNFLTEFEQHVQDEDAEFRAWIESLQELIDEDVAVRLTNAVIKIEDTEFKRFYSLVNQTTSFTYDANGVLTQVTASNTDDSVTAVSEFRYNSNGELTRIITTVTPTEGDFIYTETVVLSYTSGNLVEITESYTKTAKP